jgi:hypothetical protein
MQPQQNFGDSNQGSVVCSQCGAPMPREMRFCRSCGNRLGEGVAEYTETVRFADAPASARGAASYFPGAPMAQRNPSAIYARKKRLRGMTWVWIMLGLFFAGGGGMSMLVKNVSRGTRTGVFSTASVNRPFFGVDGFKTTDGGVTFDAIATPDSPADKANLVGGDIITSFDSHPVSRASEITDLVAGTPIGKKVEVIYTRDGEVHNTQLTIISYADYEQLRSAFNSRPEGKGHLAIDDSDAHRVLVPGMKIYGVQLNDISTNGPADLAGIKEGDIVIEFGGVPIRTVAELVARDHRAIPYSIVTAVVMRGGQRLEIPVKMGKD